MTSDDTDTSERNHSSNSVCDHREYMTANSYHPRDYTDGRRNH